MMRLHGLNLILSHVNTQVERSSIIEMAVPVLVIEVMVFTVIHRTRISAETEALTINGATAWSESNCEARQHTGTTVGVPDNL